MKSLLEEFSYGLFFQQTIIFFIVLLILKKFAWKPILKSINLREKKIKDAIKESNLARKEIKELDSKKKEIIKNAKIEKQNILNYAYKLKNKIILESKEKAKNESDKIIELTKISIENEKKLALNELKNEIGFIAIYIAKKILKKELSNEIIEKELIENLLKRKYSK